MSDLISNSNTTNGAPTIAVQRLEQLTQQLAPTPKPVSRPKKKSSANEAPADWSDILGELDKIKEIARTPRTNTTGYKQHKQAGKLWVRERIELLIDEGSFREVGSAAGTVKWVKRPGPKLNAIEEEKEYVGGFTPSNNVQGFGLLRGRKILLTADDFTIRAGHADGALMPKTVFMEKLSVDLKMPMIKLVDGSSGGGSITTYKTENGSYLPTLELLPILMQELNLGIPQCAAVVGPAVGLGAARAAVSHFSVISADIGALFNAGPKIVEGATFEQDLSPNDLGGPHIHCTNGTIDNVAPNEKACYDEIARFLSYVPNHGGAIPPIIPTADHPNRSCIELRTIIPRRRQRMYQVRKIITSIFDKDSFMEIGTYWGTTAVVGFARLGGRPVGVIANNPEVGAGALDHLGSQKLSKHLKVCDVFGLPIIQLIDIPGFAIGTVAEKGGVMKFGTELYKVYFTTTIPIFTVVTRRCYGIAGAILADCRNPSYRVAWPSGEWGSIPLEGGLEVNHRADLKAAGDKRNELYSRLEAEYTNLQNPIRTANKFGIPEIIDPADTRSVVCAWTEHMYENTLPERHQRRICGQIQPSFR